jgi:hypothetical protein
MSYTLADFITDYSGSGEYSPHKAYLTKHGWRCHGCVSREYPKLSAEIMADNEPTVRGMAVNWESPEVFCDLCDKHILPIHMVNV